MRALDEIIAESERNSNGDHLSDAAFPALRELAKDGRFDDITRLLQDYDRRFDRRSVVFVVTKVCGILISNFFYRAVSAKNTVVEDYVRDQGIREKIENAALKDGQLSALAIKMVEDINRLAKPAQ